MAAIYATVYGIILFSVLPQVVLDLYFFPLKTSGMVFVKGYSLNSYKVAFNRMGSAIFNTIRIPLIALVLVVLFATFISYLAVRKRNLFTNLIDSLSMVPYIVPGTVLGIAFISSFNTGLFGSGFLMITGTAFILIMSLSVRRLPYTIRSSVASLQQIAPSIEEAAESLGSSRLNTFAKITTPMMLSGIISGAILSLGHNDFRTFYFYPPLQCQNKNNDCSHLYRGSQRELRCSRSLVNYPDCSNSRFLALVYENL